MGQYQQPVRYISTTKTLSYVLSYTDYCALTKRIVDPAEKEGSEDNSEGIHKQALYLDNKVLMYYI